MAAPVTIATAERMSTLDVGLMELGLPGNGAFCYSGRD